MTRNCHVPFCRAVGEATLLLTLIIRDEGLQILAVGHTATASGGRVRPSKGTAFARHLPVIDILAAVKRTAIPKPHDLGFCFFPEGFFAPALTDLLCSGLMVATWTDTASPAAKIFLLALISRSWCVPQSGQSHSRTFNGIFSAIYPQLLHLLELGNHLSISM